MKVNNIQQKQIVSGPDMIVTKLDTLYIIVTKNGITSSLTPPDLEVKECSKEELFEMVSNIQLSKTNAGDAITTANLKDKINTSFTLYEFSKN